MPIRIYALAKQLNLDSKSLVDICAQAGVSGKGSALASLSDEEVDKVKAFLASGSSEKPAAKPPADTPLGRLRGKRATAKPEKAAPLRPEDYIAPTAATNDKIRVISKPRHRDAPRPADTESAPTPPRSPEPVEPAALTETPPAQTPPSEEKPLEPVPVSPAASVEAPESRAAEEVAPPEPVQEEPTAERDKPAAKKPAAKKPGAKPRPEPPVEPPEFHAPQRPPATDVSRPIPVLSGSKRAKDKETPKRERNGREERRNGPTIKLAPMPKLKEPARKPKSEPAAQKPEIRLPLDAIRSGKVGSKPLAEHIKQQEEKKRKKEAKKKTGKKQGQKETAETSDEEARGGVHGRRTRGKEREPLSIGGREQRQLKRKRATRRRREDEPDRPFRRTYRRTKKAGVNTAAPRKSNVVVEIPCTVREFSEALSVPAASVLTQLLKLGQGVGMNISAELDSDLAELIAVELGLEVDFRRQKDLEEQLIETTDDVEDAPETLKARPPVITFLGHVDHGKTSLLDRIIDINVVSGEKGGITQHIRAYEIEKDGQPIVFVDTPGHEAFTEMRARGANVTDIAVLVVAADDGVMPQTEEAISHAKAAGVPIVVALNKIDIPGVSEQKAYEGLATNELLPTAWGGDTEVVPTSATTGQGVQELLDTLLMIAELHELKANPDRFAVGTCLESEMHEDRGVIAKLLVEKGTLHVGDVVVCGSAFGRVKAMYDTLRPDVRHETAGPSTPVNVTGLSEAPGAGDRFYVLEDISKARELAEERADRKREKTIIGGKPKHVTLENLFERLGEAEVQTLNVILRADVRGSIEAIQKELTKLDHPGGADQSPPGNGRRHYRGRRSSGGRVRRDYHRLQCRPRTKGRGCWPTNAGCKSGGTILSTS